MKQYYGFSFEKWKIRFTDTAKSYQKKYKTPLWKYAIPKKMKHLVSMPFIYAMIIPAIILDIFLLIYQQTALRLYGIPRVRRSEYIVYDRKHLSYLNLIQKINCLYCSYVNWLFSYAVEIAWRTERYWCPIKSAKRKAGWHEWERFFADYGDPEKFKEVFNSNKDFFKASKLKKQKI